jgi:hypothetical protein
MGASCTRGNSNNSAYGIPIGGGTAKQGLVSTKNMAINGAMVNHIRTRAGGENRDLVFCVNQLGGVGKNRSQFGTTADGLGRIGCPGRPRSDGLTLLAALLTVGPDPQPWSYSIVGYVGSGLAALGPTYYLAGSLIPSGTQETEILGIYTHNIPPSPAVPPQQIHIGIAGVTPSTITFTGGDLTRSYTVKRPEAHYTPPSNPAVWPWLNQGFDFTPGVTYTMFLDY